MDYEKVLEDVGGLGRYQFIMFNILAITSFKTSMDIQIMVLQCYAPSFTCLSFFNSSQAHGNATGKLNYNMSCDALVNNTCLDFEYDKSMIHSSLVTEYDLVCDRSWWTLVFQNAFFIGNGLGMIFGTLSDRIGRRNILIISCLLDIIITPLVVLMPSPITQTLIRLAKGFPVAAYYQVGKAFQLINKFGTHACLHPYVKEIFGKLFNRGYQDTCIPEFNICNFLHVANLRLRTL